MRFIIVVLLFASTLNTFSQNVDCISNSLKDYHQKSNPTLIYSYDNSSQTHNYSNNWDFDKDGINDEVYFVGSGGAHLYYFLKVVLSTDKKPREFNFVESDSPVLIRTDTLNFDQKPIGFVVTELGKNETLSIIVRLDEQSYYASKKLLTEKNIMTKNVVIFFVNGITKYGNL